MACSCVRPNYKGPGVGAWCLGLSLQFAVGALMIFLGVRSHLDLLSDPTSGINFDQSVTNLLNDCSASKVVNIFGWFHLIIAAAIGVVVTLGLFVCSIFMLPLCIVGWIQTAYCVISAIVTSVFLRKYLDNLSATATPEEALMHSGDLLFIQMNYGGLLTATLLAFAAAIVLGRASRVSSGESVPGTFMMLIGMALFAAIGALMAAGGGGLAPTPAFAVLWVTLTVLGCIFMNIRSCLCTRLCNVLMFVLFGVGAILSILTAAVFAYIYISVLQNPSGNLEYTALFIVMGKNGGGLAAAAILSMAALVFSVITTFYSARSLVCCGAGVPH